MQHQAYAKQQFLLVMFGEYESHINYRQYSHTECQDAGYEVGQDKPDRGAGGSWKR